MKNKITTNFARFNDWKALLLALSALFVLPQWGLPQTGITPGGDASIKYVGTEGHYVVFQLEIDNETEAPYTIRIKDEAGNLLFYRTLRDKKISKKFHFNKDEIGELVTFIVNSKKEQKIETYQVDRNIRVVEDVVVTKQ